MTHIICEKCNVMIKNYNTDTKKNIIQDDIYSKFHIFCNECKKNIKFCNKMESKKAFFLNENDLLNIKSLYSTNNKSILYMHSELKEYAIKKYGDMNVIEQKKEKEIIKKNNLLKTKNENKKMREKIITNYFNDNKLELKPYGDCYSYINNGYPSLNEIAKNEIKKNEQKNLKYLELTKELSKLNIPFDESCNMCYEYINNVGCRNLQETIRMVELEYFLKTKTSYNKYMKKYGKDISREYAIRQYMLNNNKDNIINNIKEEITIEFD